MQVGMEEPIAVDHSHHRTDAQIDCLVALFGGQFPQGGFIRFDAVEIFHAQDVTRAVFSINARKAHLRLIFKIRREGLSVIGFKAHVDFTQSVCAEFVDDAPGLVAG